MAGLSPLPPSVVHSSTRLTHAQAHARLAEFLANAENDAAYRPDSTLTERGPQSSSTGANPNLTLHHLRRILHGIEGKRIGGEDVGRFFGEGARVSDAGHAATHRVKRRMNDDVQEDPDGQIAHDRKRKQIADTNPEDEFSGPGIKVVEEQDGWQAKEDYELAQNDNDVDMNTNERNPAGDVEQPTTSVEADQMAEIKIKDTGRKVGLSKQHSAKSTVDKEARKKAKKAKSKEERRKKEEAKVRARNT